MKAALVSVLVDDPVKAHRFYTEALGFKSQQFDPEAQLAIVVSPESPEGTALLLEPKGDSFAKDFQERAYQEGLPVIVFSADDLPAEIERLQAAGVVFREDLANPEWGMEHLFEDMCGNLIMLQKTETAG